MNSGPAPAIVVVMGVSASGKSTMGRLLAQRLDVPLVEGDDFHPAANIAKMTAGQALDDGDREPWLRSIARSIRDTSHAHRGAVVTCSALKRKYRDVLRAAGPGVWFLYLALDEETAHARIAHRTGHFMKARLLDSQYGALEPLQDDEPGLTVDAGAGTDAIIGSVQAAIARFRTGGPA
ncbi:gluconokinase [Streptomyces sp. H39-S7]|uniref:gluconokinase n=1 Tax=Streptomyces sp. H39-S7 TaxID=3004357 RepID=UPI0022B03184|nr:gluconokinase [Streptomyces sp. H39-S7]MCZ4122346.1 gluconokinase [Streptomyces sp. H39-S7]